MKHIISKRIEFDAGHRLAKGYIGKCGAIHGHRYAAVIYFESNQLDQFDMVIDFNRLAAVKRWIDENLDHALLLYKEDPVVGAFEQAAYAMEQSGVQQLDVYPLRKLYLCDDNPTAEYIAMIIAEAVYEILGEEMAQNQVKLQRVQVWETPTSEASFYTGE